LPSLTQPAPSPVPAPRWGRWIGTGIAVIGLASVGVAGGLGAQLGGLEQRARAEPSMASATPLQTQAIHTAQAANLLFAVGGGVALAGAGVFVWKF
jgi:drug/metabolite transporter (DMT)-like permease